MPSVSKRKGTEGVAAVASARAKAEILQADRTALPAIKAKKKPAPIVSAAAAAKRAAAAAGSASEPRYGKFGAALRQIDATLDMIRATNDRAAKRLA